jgi:hypothetical protein
MVNSDDLNALARNQNINPLKRFFEAFFEVFESFVWQHITGIDDLDLHDFKVFCAVIFPGSSIRYKERTKHGEEFLTNAPHLFLFDRFAIAVSQWQMNLVFPHKTSASNIRFCSNTKH